MPRTGRLSTRDAALAAGLFAGFVVLFAVTGAVLGWPTGDAWGTAIFIALGAGAAPIALRLLHFLEASRSVIDVAGMKIDFSAGRLASSQTTLPDNIVAPGVPVNDSSTREVERTAREASAATVVVVDLKEGRAWYATRLLALAVGVADLAAPRAIVFVARRGNVSNTFVGWAAPGDVARLLTEAEPAYCDAVRTAAGILRHLELSAADPAPAYPPGAQDAHMHREAYRLGGRLALVPIVIQQLEAHEAAAHPWLAAPDLERRLDACLHREAVDLEAPEADQVRAVLGTEVPFVAAVRGGRYAGMIEVDLAVRQIVRQMVRNGE